MKYKKVHFAFDRKNGSISQKLKLFKNKIGGWNYQNSIGDVLDYL